MRCGVAGACTVVLVVLTRFASAQNPNLPPPASSQGARGEDKTGAVPVLKCDTFGQYDPKVVLSDENRQRLWETTAAAENFIKCVDAQHAAFDAALTAFDQTPATATPARRQTINDLLVSEYLALRHISRWNGEFQKRFRESVKEGVPPGKPASDAKPQSGQPVSKPRRTTSQSFDVAEVAARMNRVFVAYQFGVNEELDNHGLAQSFSGVLKAGATFLERGGSTSTTTAAASPTTTPAGQLTPSDAATNTGQSPLAHIDLESKHFGSDRGTPVDWSFTTTFGFQPVLTLFKAADKTLSGTDNKKSGDPSTAYKNAFVFNVGSDLHMATFHAGEISVSGRLGVINLTDDLSIVDQADQSYLEVPVGGSKTRLYSEVGIHASLYSKGIDLAHLQKLSLTPLFRFEGGIRRDPRFADAGDAFSHAGLRTFIRVSANDVPIVDRINRGSNTFSLGFAWEYDGPWFISTPGKLEIPSGNRFIVRADVNLLKALRPPPPAESKTHQDELPGAPVVRAEARDGEIALTWEAVTLAETYTVYRRAASDKDFGTPLKAGIKTTTYSDEDAAAGTAYVYAVAAVNSKGEGKKSNEATVTARAATKPDGSGGTAPPASAPDAEGGGGSPRQTLAIDVVDGNSGRAVRAHVKMNERPAPIDRDTDGDGHVEFNLTPGPRDFVVSADGYDPQHLNVDNSCAGDPPCSAPRTMTVKLTSSHFDPSTLTEDQLRAFRGSLSGIYLDAIKPQCPEDPETHIRCQADNGSTPRGLTSGVVFTANYRLYTPAQRKAIRDAYTSRGYTHFPISIFTRDVRDYHGVYPAIATDSKVGLNDALHELYDNDGRSPIIPVCFVMSDDEPDDATTPLRLPVDFDRSLCRIVVAYWEHYETDCAMAKVHAAFPSALQYYHNPVNTDAGYGDACWPGAGKPYPGGFAWYAHARSAYGLRGLLLQTGEGSVQDTVGRIADFTASFGAGLRADPAVIGLDVVWFEDTNTVYNNFWGGGSEQENIQRADQILKYMTTPLCEDDQRRVVPTSKWCGFIKGFGSGGTVRR